MKTEKDSLSEDEKENLVSILKKLITYKVKAVELWGLMLLFLLGVFLGYIIK